MLDINFEKKTKRLVLRPYKESDYGGGKRPSRTYQNQRIAGIKVLEIKKI